MVLLQHLAKRGRIRLVVINQLLPRVRGLRLALIFLTHIEGRKIPGAPLEQGTCDMESTKVEAVAVTTAGFSPERWMLAGTFLQGSNQCLPATGTHTLLLLFTSKGLTNMRR
tara:strand:- start:229 stop:564 length:336 start_codon:yes stop_codon:yes gene_type:complete